MRDGNINSIILIL